MRNLLITILIVLIVITLVYKYYGIQKAFQFDFSITAISGNFTQILSSLLDSNVQKQLTVYYVVNVKNKSSERIQFRNLRIELSYMGFPIGSTPPTADNLKTTVLDPMKDYDYTGSLNVLLNGTTVNLASSVLAGNPVKIEYKVKVQATIFRVPISVKGTFDYQK